MRAPSFVGSLLVLTNGNGISFESLFLGIGVLDVEEGGLLGLDRLRLVWRLVLFVSLGLALVGSLGNAGFLLLDVVFVCLRSGLAKIFLRSFRSEVGLVLSALRRREWLLLLVLFLKLQHGDLLNQLTLVGVWMSLLELLIELAEPLKCCELFELFFSLHLL